MGRIGEVCQEYLKKGSLVYLEGRRNKILYQVVALGLQFLDGKDKEEPVLTVEEEASDYEA